ncbi:TetR family transcriptional regulator [Sphaerisporangium krabiense]|uniref:AcrR family transcriptional regulator n=1 Tax=Sphaerisporangium krabiense TaxID=763782 RepID=A0A7W8Z9R5_9ACTN|nr:TetR/AcrR family transcriptional regulator [Sphaerisporangium krabiense]MBB5630002.1 AcrR family transcriptional regulator [Sphaerisporangium krabiense]GII64947.1 TetR family transcriptional regulator [Sphaerisporangium krabiense]
MRADARRNRDLIVATAVELFTGRGPGVSMEEIARAAGLGVGTLYRHFPDRQALLEEIAVDSLRRLLTTGRELAAQGLPGWQVLRLMTEHCVELPLSLTKSLSGAPTAHPELPGLVGDVDALLTRIAEQAQREGAMRPDIPPREVVGLLNVAVCRPGARADDALTTVILDGLRASPA